MSVNRQGEGRVRVSETLADDFQRDALFQTATASRSYDDLGRVEATLADLDSAPIERPLRATLRMLGKLTVFGTLHVEDMQTVLAEGVTAQQVDDALGVCFAFNTTNRLANAFGFEVLSPEGFEAGAKYLLKRGYRSSAPPRSMG